MTDGPRTITPSQTVGPFYSFCLTRPPPRLSPLGDHRLITPDAHGTPVTIRGAIFDGEQAPVPDGLIEVWQADGRGLYRGAGNGADDTSFTGFGRVDMDAQGRFVIETVKPGRVPAPDGGRQAPHLALGIFGKGLNRRLYTRMYFDDEPSNSDDPVLKAMPEARRRTLVAQRMPDGCYEFVIRLQGRDETVFLEA